MSYGWNGGGVVGGDFGLGREISSNTSIPDFCILCRSEDDCYGWACTFEVQGVEGLFYGQRKISIKHGRI